MVLLNNLGKPRVEALHGSDIGGLVASGILLGVAVVGLLGRLRVRNEIVPGERPPTAIAPKRPRSSPAATAPQAPPPPEQPYNRPPSHTGEPGSALRTKSRPQSSTSTM
jgi:hypothetical protein